MTMLWRMGLSIAIAAAIGGISPARAQSTPASSLADQQAVEAADTAFWRAFNACDAASMASFLAEDVEFYHDITGLTRSREGVIDSLTKGPCGTPDLHMRREPVATTMRYQAIPGFGAMLTGEHVFYARQGTAPESAATVARFLVIWKVQSGRWLMTRVVSYDHHPPLYQPPTPISVRPDLLKRYVGRYHTKASGDIEVTFEGGALVLRSGGLRITLAASAPGRFFALERDLRVNFLGAADHSTIEIEENGRIVARGSR